MIVESHQLRIVKLDLSDIDFSESINKSLAEDSRRRTAEFNKSMDEFEQSMAGINKSIENISVEPISTDL